MPHVKLRPRDHYRFHFSTHVRVTDLSRGNHLGHDSVVSLLQEAKAQMFRNLQIQEDDFGDGQTGYVLGELQTNYLKQAFAFDELEIFSDIGEFGDKSFRIFQAIYRDNTLVALSESGCVAFNFKQQCSTTIPEQFRSLFNLEAII